MPAAFAAQRIHPARVETERKKITIPWVFGFVFLLTVDLTGRLVRWMVTHPVMAFGIVLGLWTWAAAARHGGWVALAVAGGVGVPLVVWRLVGRESFQRFVSARTVGAIRAAATYRPGWRSACEGTALVRKLHDKTYLPKLVKVRSRGAVDVVTAKMLPGQTLDDWLLRGDYFATCFDAVSCRIRAKDNGPKNTIELRMLSHDPFTKPVAPFEHARSLDLTSVPVAMREENIRMAIRVLGAHILYVGASGGGKSGGIQALVDALGPAIAAQQVRLHGIDMKGGVELSHLGPLCANFAHAGPKQAAEVLTTLVEDVLTPRLDYMRTNGIRAHVPTPDEPLHVISIDELAAITAYVTDGTLKKELNNLLAILLSQGRAAGVSVVAGVQDGRKEVVSLRGLFTYRIVFRLNEADEVDMVMSKGARNRGALCDQIPRSQPGVAYLEEDGDPVPIRVRFPHITDDRIAHTVEQFQPAASVMNLHTATDDQTGDGEDGGAQEGRAA